jgi:hypothetical protein
MKDYTAQDCSLSGAVVRFLEVSQRVYYSSEITNPIDKDGMLFLCNSPNADRPTLSMRRPHRLDRSAHRVGTLTKRSKAL